MQYADALAGLIRRLRGLIERGIADGVFTCDRADHAAAAIVAVIQGYFSLAAVARDCIPRGSAAGSTLRMAEGLLRSKQPLTDDGRSNKKGGRDE